MRVGFLLLLLLLLRLVVPSSSFLVVFLGHPRYQKFLLKGINAGSSVGPWNITLLQLLDITRSCM